VYTVCLAGKSPYIIYTVIYGADIRFWPTLAISLRRSGLGNVYMLEAHLHIYMLEAHVLYA